jgi:hypothetical protein
MAAGSERDFPLYQVDLTSLTYGPARAPLVHKKAHRLWGEIVAHFRFRDTGIDETDQETCLEGRLKDGQRFRGCAPR